ncbi:MAG: outer membrane beta-barrel protein [Smithella sp.]
MKKTFAGVVGLFMLLMLPVVSFSAAPGPYITGNMGMSFLTDSDMSDPYGTVTLEFDPGFATSFAGGYNFGMFRVEGEIGYQINDIDKVSAGGYSANASGDVTALSLMANGYFDFVNKTPFTPYITAGIGMARLDVNDFAIRRVWIGDSDDTVFAYQFGAGIAYAINKNFSIDLRYRYFATSDPDFDGVDSEFASHNVYLGLRYSF